jgi:hypothetical protein
MSEHEKIADQLDHAGPLTRVEATSDGLRIIFQRMTLDVPDGYTAQWRGRPPSPNR